MNIAATISINAAITVNEPDRIADPAGRLRNRFVRVAYDDQPYNSIWTCCTGTTVAGMVLYNVAVSPSSRLPEDITGLAMWRSSLQAFTGVSPTFLQPQIYGYTPGWYYARFFTGTAACEVNFVPAVFQGNIPPSIPAPIAVPAPAPTPRP